MGSKDVATLTYNDLPFTSKFFFIDGCEDSEAIFPDETRNNPQVQKRSALCKLHNPQAIEEPHFVRAFAAPKILDFDIALDAASGDTIFLVSIGL